MLHVISGGETGGSRKHLITLLQKFSKDEVSLVVFQKGKLYEEALEAHLDVQVLLQRTRYDLSVLKRLTDVINKGKYDIVHTHGPRTNLFLSVIKKKICATWITTIHSDPTLDFVKSGIKGYLFTKLHLYALKKVDYFFAVSEKFKEGLVSFGIQPNKISTIYNGIDFSDLNRRDQSLYREQLKLENDDFLITMVARLHPIKGHELVFKALEQINQPKMKLLLVGDGPIEDSLKKKAKNLQVSKQVYFLGFRNDVDEIYSASDVAIMASYSESFPLALLEAANQGVPVISTEVGGVKQLVLQNNGWVVPVGSVTKIADALMMAYELRQANELHEMGKRLYTHASTNFSLDNLYQQITQTYQHFIGENE